MVALVVPASATLNAPAAETSIAPAKVPALPLVERQPAAVPADTPPSAEWSPDELAAYARHQLGESGSIESSLGLMARRSTVAFYRAGHALMIARQKLKEVKGWEKWCEDRGVKKTTAWEAMKLVENAKDETAVATLALTEAKKRFGVSGSTKAKKKTEKADVKVPQTAKVKGNPDTLARLLAVAETSLIAARETGRNVVGSDFAEARPVWERLNANDGVLDDLARLFSPRTTAVALPPTVVETKPVVAVPVATDRVG